MVEGYGKMGDLTWFQSVLHQWNDGPSFPKGNLIHAVAEFDGGVHGENRPIAGIENITVEDFDFLVYEIFRLAHFEIAKMQAWRVCLLLRAKRQSCGLFQRWTLRRSKQNKIGADG